MKLLVAALALGAAVPGLAVAHPVPTAAPADEHADAAQLVGLLLSDESMLALAGRAFDYGVSQDGASDPAVRKLYDANPGMKEYVAGRIRPEFRTILRRELPKLRRDLIVIVTDEMTPDEIADTLTFFASPTGAKMKAHIYESIGDKPDQSEAEMQQSAIAAAMADLTPDDYPALMAFGASSAAQKMQVVSPKMSAASQAWASQMIAANGARLKGVAESAQAEYLARKPKAEAGS